MQHYAISKLRYVSSDAVCSVGHMVAYKTLKHWKTQIKRSSEKVVAVADKRWPFTRGSNLKALSGEILMFLLGGHTWTLDRIFNLDSRVIEISMQQLPCRIDILQTRVPLKYCSRCLLKGSLRNDYDDGNENVKKEIGLDKQNNNSARASRFFVHFSVIVARLQRETA